MIVLGLMSGTSADGVDGAIVEIELEKEKRVEILYTGENPYPNDLRERILNVIETGGDAAKIAQLNFEIGEFFGKSALKFMENSQIEPELIASHGQTIVHIPRKDEKRGFYTPSTLQIGEGALIAELTGIPVISDFRVADIAAGGEGAPLVPLPDYILFHSDEKSLSLHNIGGISNLTYIKKGGKIEDVIAFDTGPGNTLINQAMEIFFNKPMDLNGEVAKRGRVRWELIQRWLEHPYFKLKPPKSTGRELFNMNNFPPEKGMKGEDVVATYTWFTILSIKKAYKDFIIESGLDEIIIGGGGALNPVIMEGLRRELAPIPVLAFDEIGFPGNFREAIAFAILGYLAYRRYYNNLPSATGAKHFTVMGKLSYPPNWGKRLF